MTSEKNPLRPTLAGIVHASLLRHRDVIRIGGYLLEAEIERPAADEPQGPAAGALVTPHLLHMG